jgi:hypothetical protein
MIICDVCRVNGNPTMGCRYVLPLRTLDTTGMFQVPETYSLDLCDGHFGEFRARFLELLDAYSEHPPESAPAPVAPQSPPAVPDDQWFPETGKTYGKGDRYNALVLATYTTPTGKRKVKIKEISGNHTGHSYSISVGSFILWYGRDPVPGTDHE